MSARAAAADVVSFVAVVVPARDEEALLPRCLDHLRAARERLTTERPWVRVVVVVVLDGCTDGSKEVAVRAGVEVVDVDLGSVGAARAAGVARVAALAGRTWGRGAWIAHTDADSAVPAHWLTEHVRQAEGGADVVVGTVRPDPGELDAERLAVWATTRTDVPNGHVHGANLGVRASVDAAVGGVAPLREHEDVDLVARARDAGARVVAVGTCDVLTSARLEGRTEGGYARYLREGLLGVGAAGS